jgi:hypothetical protein
MDPPEVTISNVTPSQQLSSNVEGCRNALSRVLASSEQGLNFVPPPSAWTFVGRVLHTARRQVRVRTSLSIDDAIDDGRTMEYVFVCYVKSAFVAPINGTSRLGNGDFLLPIQKDSLSATKWVSRAKLTALFLNEQANDIQLENKFRAVATTLLELNKTVTSDGHDYWIESNSLLQPLSRELIYEVENLPSAPPQILQYNDR